MKRAENRNSLMAKVHIAKKDLGLDDAVYRALLERVTGQESAKDCSEAELARAVAEFRRLGWQPTGTPTDKPKGKGKSAKPGAPSAGGKAALTGKITALLAEAGRPDEYAVAIARRMYGRDALAFCSAKELQGVIAALSRDAKRHGRRA